MSIRLVRKPDLAESPEITGDDLLPVETTYEGQTFAWGPGKKRGFGDDGVAAAHVAYSATDPVIEDSRDVASRS